LLAAALSPLFSSCSRDLAARKFQPRSILSGPTPNDGNTHSLTFGDDGITFLLDGKPYQIRSGEMHPPRIPREYWRHRIQMAKAMGMNTIAVYVMWNFHETSEGKFEFDTDERDVEAFIRLCQEEGMWVLLRPGPYICGEWDLGGLPLICSRTMIFSCASALIRSALHGRREAIYRRTGTTHQTADGSSRWPDSDASGRK
jgi:beta-galactosidase